MTKNQTFKIALILSAVVLLIGLVLGLVTGINYEGIYKSTSMITVEFGEEFNTQDIEKTLSAKGIKADSIVKSGESVGNQNSAIVRVAAKDGSAAQEALAAAYENAEVSEAQTVTAGAKTSNLGYTALWILAGAIVSALYLLIRFGMKAGVYSFCICVFDALFTVSVAFLLRLSVGGGLLAAVMLVVACSLLNTTTLCGSYRLVNSESTRNDHETTFNKAVLRNRFRLGFCVIIGIVMLLAIMLLGSSALTSFVIPGIIGIVFSAVSNSFIMPYIYERATAE